MAEETWEVKDVNGETNWKDKIRTELEKQMDAMEQKIEGQQKELGSMREAYIALGGEAVTPKRFSAMCLKGDDLLVGTSKVPRSLKSEAVVGIMKLFDQREDVTRKSIYHTVTKFDERTKRLKHPKAHGDEYINYLLRSKAIARVSKGHYRATEGHIEDLF